MVQLGAEVYHLVNAELAAKIAEELKMEQEFREAEIYTEEVKAYLDNSPFEVCGTTPMGYISGAEAIIGTRHTRSRGGRFDKKVR